MTSVPPGTALGPLLMAISVYVKLTPVATTETEVFCVIVRSAPATVAVLLAVLLAVLGSNVVELTVVGEGASVMIVPRGVPVVTVTTIVIVDVPAFASAPVAVHVSVPAAPAATPEQL